MTLSGKFWGGILGMIFAGPLGAIAGVYIGHQIDASKPVRKALNDRAVFHIHLLSVLAYVAKVDGHVDKREVDTIYGFFRQMGLPDSQMPVMERTLNFALAQTIDLQTTCAQFRKAANYETCLMLLRLVYLVAMADKKMHPKEKAAIEAIAHYLGITDTDFEILRAEFLKSNDKYYKLLGLTPGASMPEVKKAYRKLALQYHPDRVAYLGAEYAKVAEEKFKMINEAYQKVTEELKG